MTTMDEEVKKVEEATKRKNDAAFAAFEEVVKTLDQLEPARRARVLLAVALLCCPQALTPDQVVQAFQGARLG